MSLVPGSLLAGPRGRRLCGEILWGGRDRRDALGGVNVFPRGSRHLLAHPGAIAGPVPGASTFDEADVATAAAALRRIAPPDLTDAVLEAALAVTVDLAAYWQPPHGEDILLATDEMRPVLEPVARAIAESPLTAWWSSPVDRLTPASVGWEHPAEPEGNPVGILSRWRADMDADERRFAREFAGRDVSGTWWSTPPFALPRTTRVRGAGGPVGLTLVEDSLGWTTARVQPVTPPVGEVLEIDGPDAWAALCRRHPVSVSASRRHVWEMTTGRSGAWVQPDWASVAREAVGVHLSVAGYLSTAGRVVDVGEREASVLAGWGPDETFWFDTVAPSGPAEDWAARTGADGRRWHRA
ncbi:hypothetical protein [Microbacterium sp. VKM Ac-2923]|uniref:hypothetical protein n=1 Tax=Microbacterium sp. VKM Ac-2923 TaxID=2929476 RepID=UPI001FB39E6F|nr:hypothetical protein [Microbacterium sp. VKM Ac-2923]MCJ1708154.1 hypothetical protein [Microbacterium sp. VKM Ac-2923]